MPIFEYKAFTETGATKTGILDADTAREARVKLRKDNVHVIDLKQVDDQTKEARRFSLESLFVRRKKIGQLAMITRQFATLLDAGVPMTEAMKVMIEQMSDRAYETVFRSIREKLTQGSSLADALAQHPMYFNELYVNMVKAGEASGHVDQVLFRVADYLQKQNRLKNKVVSALMYPMIMVGVGTIVVTVLMTFVVPKIIKLVKMKGDQMPTPTRILITASEFLRDYWSLLFAAIVALFVVLGMIRRTDKGRFATDKLILNLPLFGDLFKKQAVSRFAITMATLLKSGVPVLEALNIVKSIVNNSVVEKVLGDVHDRIVEGQDIATPIKRSGLFPPTVGYMIAVGEQSGRLEEILDKLSEAYDEEIDVATQRMTSLIEPILILGMSVIVTFIILSVLLPMLQLSSFSTKH